MNLLTTLFGGAITVGVLFGVLGLLRFAPYWRAVVSCALPLFAYFTLAVMRWPGLDVVSMHVVVFVATAAILGLVAARRKVGAPIMHWAPKVLIGFFLVLFAVNATLVYLSSHGLPDWAARLMPDADRGGVNTAFPGVVAHDTGAAKGIRAHLKKQAQQSQLGWQVDLTGLDRVRTAQAVPITLQVLDRHGVAITDARIEIDQHRPAQEAALATTPVNAVRHGQYRGELRFDAPGEWVVLVRIIRDQDKLELQQAVSVTP